MQLGISRELHVGLLKTKESEGVRFNIRGFFLLVTIPRNKAVVRINLGMDDCAAGGISQNSFYYLVAVTRQVNFFDACLLSKEISTCDIHSGSTPRCLREKEVSKVQRFTSSAARNVAKNRVIFATLVY